MNLNVRARMITTFLMALMLVLYPWASWKGRAPGWSVTAAATPPSFSTAATSSLQQVARNPIRNAYFGDLHVHTSWSTDAYAAGNRSDPREAYRFGQGEVVVLSGGNRVQLRVPLDFMAVTDHDNSFAEVPLCLDPSDSAYGSPVCRELTNVVVPRSAAPDCQGTLGDCMAASNAARERYRVQAAWRMVIKNANDFYRSGKFTTFPAYEFTSGIQGSLHRNVIYRGEGLPNDILRTSDVKGSPERLWEWLERECTGECQVAAIPHNTNRNLGIQLGVTNSDGTPFTEEGLKRRARNEYLVEMFQAKGSSECALGLGTTDEQCNFELVHLPCKPGQKKTIGESSMPACAVAPQFVRNALKTGLLLEAEFGVNPYKLGFVGGTDTHASAAGAVAEDKPVGHYSTFEDTPLERRDRRWSEVTSRQDVDWGTARTHNPGGLVGVWAEENTRASIFGALKRKETFATSGPRIRVRFFGGWNYTTDLHKRPHLIDEAYTGGVPMGGDLPMKPGNAAAPRFLIWATKDPNSANLQKLQVVKGWTVDGQSYEKTYDVACADGARPDARTGHCEGHAATVNLEDCSYSRDSGDQELSTAWTDPDFNPLHRAFYYVRVLEIPTCRWSSWDAITLKVAPAAGVSPTVEERAWSSPIWYTPARQ